MNKQRTVNRETYILTELEDVVLLAVEEDGEIIGYLPYHRVERTILTLTDDQLNQLFQKMTHQKPAHKDLNIAAAS